MQFSENNVWNFSENSSVLVPPSFPYPTLNSYVFPKLCFLLFPYIPLRGLTYQPCHGREYHLWKPFFISTQKCNFYKVFFYLLIWSNWQWKYPKSASSVLKSWKVDEKTGVALELPLCVITWTAAAAGLKWPCRRSFFQLFFFIFNFFNYNLDSCWVKVAVEEKWRRGTFTFLDGNMSNIVKQDNYSLEMLRVLSRGVSALSYK